MPSQVFPEDIAYGNFTPSLLPKLLESILQWLDGGFQKKTDKTPKNEIEKAKRLKQKYYEEKSRK
jgi:hypothetical protein